MHSFVYTVLAMLHAPVKYHTYHTSHGLVSNPTASRNRSLPSRFLMAPVLISCLFTRHHPIDIGHIRSTPHLLPFPVVHHITGKIVLR